MGLFDGTELERPVLCEQCGRDVRQCRCPPEEQRPDVSPGQQRVRVSLEKRQRGKVVTIIDGLTGTQRQNRQLVKRLKDDCGAGGSLEGEQVELQGDHRQRVAKLLGSLGYRLI